MLYVADETNQDEKQKVLATQQPMPSSASALRYETWELTLFQNRKYDS